MTYHVSELVVSVASSVLSHRGFICEFVTRVDSMMS